jgi:transposase
MHSIEFKPGRRNSWPATFHGLAKRRDICRNLIRSWVQKYEAGVFDEEAAAAICSSNMNYQTRRVSH